MLKQIILEREVKAKEGTIGIPEGKKAYKKPTTQDIFLKGLHALKSMQFKIHLLRKSLKFW